MPTAMKPTLSRRGENLFEKGDRRPADKAPSQHGSPVRKRPPSLAKSKNPEFRASTLYLRKKTLTECEYRLKSTEDDRDMSELVEELMVTWLSNSNA